jgi:hypothetical protein
MSTLPALTWLVLLVALPLGGPGCGLPGMRSVRSVGGICYTAEDLVDYSHPPWLKEVSGGTVAEVDFQHSQPPITDLHLELLDPFKEIRCLRLDGTRVTDAGLKYLGRFEKLRKLCSIAPRLPTPA